MSVVEWLWSTLVLVIRALVSTYLCCEWQRLLSLNGMVHDMLTCGMSCMTANNGVIHLVDIPELFQLY